MIIHIHSKSKDQYQLLNSCNTILKKEFDRMYEGANGRVKTLFDDLLLDEYFDYLDYLQIDSDDYLLLSSYIKDKLSYYLSADKSLDADCIGNFLCNVEVLLKLTFEDLFQNNQDLYFFSKDKLGIIR